MRTFSPAGAPIWAANETSTTAQLVIPALPYLLSFAAGAMLYVVVEELIPEMSQGKHSNIGTIFFAAGFSVMMTLDVALCGAACRRGRRAHSPAKTDDDRRSSVGVFAAKMERVEHLLYAKDTENSRNIHKTVL